LASTRDLLRDLRQDRRLWVGALAISWFWMTGAVALALIPVLIRHKIGAGIEVETAVSALFAIGIAIGSLLAAKLAHGWITTRPVPYAALGMAGFLVHLGFATFGLGPALQEINLTTFFTTPFGIHIAIDVVGLAIAGGLFVVPLFAFVQYFAPPDKRARVIGGVNVLNSAFIVSGSLLTSLLQTHWIGLSEPTLLITLGTLNLGTALFLHLKLVR
jgi:acyl-[acyl-carrier-protein]-phospholipid O-acyltransferase/long-chain-fatty-acid--[acyl-carrier-protein] ligase